MSLVVRRMEAMRSQASNHGERVLGTAFRGVIECALDRRSSAVGARNVINHVSSTITMERVEVITGRRRRRRWSWEDKERIVAEASAPGVCASAVARRYDLQPQQLFQWRREIRESRGAHGDGRFAAVRLIAGPGAGRQPEPKRSDPSGHQPDSMAEIRLDNGRVLRVRETIAPEVLMRLVGAVERA